MVVARRKNKGAGFATENRAVKMMPKNIPTLTRVNALPARGKVRNDISLGSRSQSQRVSITLG